MNKKIQSLAALGFMLSMMENYSNRGANYGSISHGVRAEKKKVIPKGCKEYTFYGFTVIAIGEKQAIRKCKKLHDAATNKKQT